MAGKPAPETVEQIRCRIHEAIALDSGLDGVDLRVFLYLSARVGFQEFVHVAQVELAATLGRRKEHISRSIRKLMERGLIVPSPKGSRASEWRFNPEYGK
jgi:predicted transcriptional regulator